MSPEEVELLQHVGQTLLLSIGIIVTKSTLYGLYLAIFAFGIRALLKRSPWTTYTWILFSFLSVLFLISTANLVIPVAHTVGLIRGGLINDADQPLLERLKHADNSVGGLAIAQDWLGAGTGGLLFIFADAVVVWRAYVLWPENIIAKVLPLALLFASFGSAIVAAALSSLFSTINTDTVPLSSATGVMITLSISLSLATNVVATMLIGSKAYYHRKMMKTSMGMQNSRSGAILLFLTESGVAYCVLQIISLVTGATGNDALTAIDYVAQASQEITAFAAAAYPILVLIIVDSHRSISDHTQGSVADSGAGQDPGRLGVESHISFAARTPPGISSTGSGGGVGVESMAGSCTDITARADHSNGTSARFRELEKDEGLSSDGALPNRHHRFSSFSITL